MSTTNTPLNSYWKRLLQYFFQGLVIIAPISATIYIVVWLFNSVDDLLPSLIHKLFPWLLGLNEDGSLKKIPGIGFLVVIMLVVGIGRISSVFLVSKMVDFFDTILENTPGVKYIYSSIKDFLEAFSGNKRKFTQPVLAQVDSENVWRVGFITQEDAGLFDLPGHKVVYVPLSYAITGVTYIVPSENIKILTHINSADAMKFALTGGVTHVDD
jgi:uncharacterized membrane protein